MCEHHSVAITLSHVWLKPKVASDSTDKACRFTTLKLEMLNYMRLWDIQLTDKCVIYNRILKRYYPCLRKARGLHSLKSSIIKVQQKIYIMAFEELWTRGRSIRLLDETDVSFYLLEDSSQLLSILEFPRRFREG